MKVTYIQLKRFDIKNYVILLHSFVTQKLFVPIMVMHTEINVLGLYSFDVKNSLWLTPRCRIMQEIHICHKLYFIKCICCLVY